MSFISSSKDLDEVWELSCLLYYYNRVLVLKPDLENRVQEVAKEFIGNSSNLPSREVAFKYLTYEYLRSLPFAELLLYDTVSKTSTIAPFKPSEDGFDFNAVYVFRMRSKEDKELEFSLIFHFDIVRDACVFCIPSVIGNVGMQISSFRDYRKETEMNVFRVFWAHYEDMLYFCIFHPLYEGRSPNISWPSMDSPFV